jgi:hypothetical protein
MKSRSAGDSLGGSLQPFDHQCLSASEPLRARVPAPAAGPA